MATIKDVAERAGVAVATVSRVMNNRGSISDKMRKRVQAAMDELQRQAGYSVICIPEKKEEAVK